MDVSTLPEKTSEILLNSHLDVVPANAENYTALLLTASTSMLGGELIAWGTPSAGIGNTDGDYGTRGRQSTRLTRISENCRIEQFAQFLNDF